MSRDQRIAAAIRRLCDAMGVKEGRRRDEIERLLAEWVDNLPTIEPRKVKTDRLYWVRAAGIDDKRRALRTGGFLSRWQVQGCKSPFTDSQIIVLREVERDDDTPDTPDGPAILTSVEDVENAPENTVAALDEHYPIVKIGGLWMAASGRILGPRELVSSARSPIHVLRWGDFK